MRIRSIKPEFWKDQTVASWSPLARLIYIGLWSMADDCGRFQADLDTIRSEVARKDRVQDVKAAFDEIVSAGKVLTWEHQGETFGVVASWWHQKINRPSPPEYPCPPASVRDVILAKASKNPRFRADVSQRIHALFTEYSVNPHDVLSDRSPPEQGNKGTREQGSIPQTPVGGLSEGELKFVPMRDGLLATGKFSDGLTAAMLAMAWRLVEAGDRIDPQNAELVAFIAAAALAMPGKPLAPMHWIPAQVAAWAKLQKNVQKTARTDAGPVGPEM